ncbi:MAG: TrkA family potassium uptake protein [Longicatena sp.]
MKIIVAGGRNKADFLIGSLLEKKHEVTVINDEDGYCQYLAEKYNIPVVIGNPCKEYILEEADIYDADILIALRPNDPDNLAICQCAKKIFRVKKVVATVSNPKNVSVFKKLGVNTAISATYTISKIIEQASTIENLVNSLSIEHEKVILSEILLTKDCVVINKKIKDVVLPEKVIICCILRNVNMVVPNGDTQLLENDKLLILSQPQIQDEVLAVFSRGYK